MCFAVPKHCPGGQASALSAELTTRSLGTLFPPRDLGSLCGVCQAPLPPGTTLTLARGDCHRILICGWAVRDVIRKPGFWTYLV